MLTDLDIYRMSDSELERTLADFKRRGDLGRTYRVALVERDDRLDDLDTPDEDRAWFDDEYQASAHG